jgi:prephenate dehydrogenase
MRVAILGLGLIGGSIARALRLAPSSEDWHVVAWSPSGDGPAAAVADGTIQEAAASPTATVAGADLVVLAAPATDCLALLDGLAGPWRGSLAPGAVITDVASTKARIGAAARDLGLRFVGGHPMAGREATGYGAATADLFAGRPWILVPDATIGEAATAIVASLARACGAHPTVMDADTHDAIVAGISHLPLLASVALVEAIAGTEATATGERADWAAAAGLSAGGWRDMTRLAKGDPRMGAAIAVTNAPAISERLRAYRDVIDEWLELLDGPDAPDEGALVARLTAARDRAEGHRDG